MNTYLQDILDQPKSLMEALSSYVSNDYLEQMNEISKIGFNKIVFTGMGSSHFCSYGACIHLNSNGLTSIIKSAGELLHYEPSFIDEKTLLVIISQSGESAEIVSIINEISKKYTMVAITNNILSTLAMKANYVFNLNVSNEESVTTRTYLSSLILVNILAKSMTGQRNYDIISEIKQAIDSLGYFLQKHEQIDGRIKKFLKVPPYICLMGRGYSLSTVHAGALFFREVSKYPSIGFDSGEFRHGPIEMVDNDFNCFIFAPVGLTCNLNYKLALNVADKGGKVVLVTNSDIEISNNNILVIRYNSPNEMLSPIVDIAPVQLAANYIAESKNFVPGKFRWSSKITRIEY